MFSDSPNAAFPNASAEIPAPAAADGKFCSPAFKPASLTALLIQALFLLLAALMLDGGGLLRGVWVAVLGHWAATAMILLRRRYNPTTTDLLLVKYAFLGILCAVVLVGWPLVSSLQSVR